MKESLRCWLVAMEKRCPRKWEHSAEVLLGAVGRQAVGEGESLEDVLAAKVEMRALMADVRQKVERRLA